MIVSTDRKQLPRVATSVTPIPDKPKIESTPQPTHATVTVTVTVPVFDWPTGHVSINTNCRWTRDQAMNLKRIQLGLEQQEAKLKNGSYVRTGTDALRYILENISNFPNG